MQHVVNMLHQTLVVNSCVRSPFQSDSLGTHEVHLLISFNFLEPDSHSSIIQLQANFTRQKQTCVRRIYHKKEVLIKQFFRNTRTRDTFGLEWPHFLARERGTSVALSIFLISPPQAILGTSVLVSPFLDLWKNAMLFFFFFLKNNGLQSIHILSIHIYSYLKEN